VGDFFPVRRRRRSSRSVVAFDAARLSQARFSRARLVLTLAGTKGLGRHGRSVVVHPLLEDFAEGNGKRLGVPLAERTRGSGAGVTWRCGTDADIANARPDCTSPWTGGAMGPATERVVHTKATSGEVSFDVTEDVRAGHSAWLLRLERPRAGGAIAYHSREGAAAAGDPNLAPRLVLE
jgi:hypothetical protein